MVTFLTLNAFSKQNELYKLKAFFPTILGTVLEYYDYALYGFSANLLAQYFFPTEDPTVALLKTFGIFLMGSLAKPLGALMFGYLGDRFGRSVSLKISMVGIAFPTLFIGLMPTYHTIGWIAPLLLLICRVLQGIFTAGESDGARIFIFESFFKTKPCFASSLSGIACLVGIYLASVASSLVMHVSDSPFLWRIPFILGGIMGGLIFVGRLYLVETPDFINYVRNSHQEADPSNTLLKVLHKNRKIILATILFCGASGGTYHFYLVFLGKYLGTLQILDIKTAAQSTSQIILIYTVCIPLASLLADRFGLIRIIRIAFCTLLGMIVCNILMLWQGSMPIALMGLTAGILACFQAPMVTLLIQRLSVGERYRCFSFGHAIGSLLFSGSAPMVSLWLWHTTGVIVIPFLYFTLLTLMGFLATFLLKNEPTTLKENV